MGRSSKIKISADKNANLSMEELEILADEIRNILIGESGKSLKEYIEMAKNVQTAKLGYRKSRAIKHEFKLRSFFPDRVFDILAKRKAVATRFNEDDKNFMYRNSDKTSDWLAAHFYTSPTTVLKEAKTMGIKLLKISPLAKRVKTKAKSNVHKR